MVTTTEASPEADRGRAQNEGVTLSRTANSRLSWTVVIEYDERVVPVKIVVEPYIFHAQTGRLSDSECRCLRDLPAIFDRLEQEAILQVRPKRKPERTRLQLLIGIVRVHRCAAQSFKAVSVAIGNSEVFFFADI